MRKNRLLILLISFMFILSGCGNNNGDNKTLNVAVAADATNLDPVSFGDDYSENVLKQIYDTLVVRTPSGEIQNSLATNIKREDPLTYTIDIRKGVKFSNGQDLTLDDVIYSLKRAAESSRYNYIYGNIDFDKTVKKDEDTVVLKLKEADGAFIETLTHPAVSIVSKKFVEEHNGDISQVTLGTGPFVLNSWKKLDEIKLKKNNNYWGEESTLENVNLRVIPEAYQRLIELESQAVDIAYKVSPNDVKSLENQKEMKLYKKVDNSTHFIGLNMQKAPFNNLYAREAMKYAIDMEAIVKSVYKGQAKIATTPINPNFKYSMASEIKPPAYNPEYAKQLLKSANIPEGTKIKLYVNDDQQRSDIATMVQSQLKKAGIDVEVVKLEWGAYMKALGQSEHNMFIMSWSPSIIDPNYELYQPFYSANKGKGPNFMFYGNNEVDRLILEGRRLPDSKERMDVYRKAQEIINSDSPWIYVCYGENLMATNKYVENFDMSPMYAQYLYKIKLNK